MSRIEGFDAILDSVVRRARHAAVRDVMAENISSVSLFELLEAFEGTEFEDSFLEFSIDEVVDLTGGASPEAHAIPVQDAPRRKARTVSGQDASRRNARTNPAQDAPSRNTRTRAGRLALDTSVLDFLRSADGVVAIATLVAAIEGTEAQIVQSLVRLRSSRQVARLGSGGSMRVRWIGGNSAAATV